MNKIAYDEENGYYIQISKYSTPLDVAITLWKAKVISRSIFGDEVTRMFTLDEIRQIGQHLINFAAVEKEKEIKHGSNARRM